MANTQNRLLLAKAETTYGTSSAPAGTDALLISDLDVEPLQLELKDRELIQGFYGNSAQLVSQRAVGIKFTTEVAGSGTAGTAPRWGCLMRACGFAETIVASTSVQYTPVSSGFESVTLDFRNDTIKHLITGARGTVEIEMEVGEVPKLNFEFTGLYAAPVDAARPSTTFSLQANPVVVNAENTATVSVHGYSACMNSFSLATENEIVYRQLAGCAREVRLTGRKPKGEIMVELPTIASKDFFTLASNQTQGVISWTHGGTAGNIVAFAANYCSFDAPSLEDGDGIQHIKLPYYPIPSGSGNNEMSLTLT